MNPLYFLISVVITAISLLIISRIPFLGVEIDSPVKAIVAGVIFGLINGLIRFLTGWLLGSTIVVILTLGISAVITFLLYVFAFGLTAKLVEGFRLRNGITSAILGALALAIVNFFAFWIVGNFIAIGS